MTNPHPNTNDPYKSSSSKEKKPFGPKMNSDSKMEQTNPDALPTQSEQKSQEKTLLIPPKNLQTKGGGLEISSTKECIFVRREDLKADIILELDTSGDDPSWQLRGTFRELENAIRFIREA